ncbi:MAG: hypothetical protein ACREJ2_04005, partial [Planctomycetota bacterium]
VVNLGIDSIAVRAPQTEDGCPANKLGIHFEDGRTLPTYDWYSARVPEPVAPSASRNAPH